jgi:hypothetical protein
MRLINLLGVTVGPEEHLVPAGAANPTGFWEHQGIVRLNDLLLRRLGGKALRPPALPVGWERSSELDDLRARAHRLIEQDFGGRSAWGWKDPRTCLTLPFWRGIVEPTHYVLCLRHPRDVARSLERRDGFSLGRALELWLLHTRSALRATRGQKRLCLVYERIVSDPVADLERLAEFVGPAVVDVSIREAAKMAVDPSLQHHRTRGAAGDEAAMHNPVIAALQLAHRAYEQLGRLHVPQEEHADRLLSDALQLIAPVIEEELAEATTRWHARRQQGIREITAAIPSGAAFILLDAMKWATEEYVDDRRRITFMEQQGQYWGPPPDDETALRELHRLRSAGAEFLACAEPAFEWLDHYPGMARWLRQTFPCLVETDCAIVFDLRRGHERLCHEQRAS